MTRIAIYLFFQKQFGEEYSISNKLLLWYVILKVKNFSMNVGRVEFGSKIIFCIQKSSWLCNKLSLHDYFSDTVLDSTMGGFMCFRNLKLDCRRNTQPHSFITSIIPSCHVTNYMRFHFLLHLKFLRICISL